MDTQKEDREQRSQRAETLIETYTDFTDSYDDSVSDNIVGAMVDMMHLCAKYNDDEAALGLLNTARALYLEAVIPS